MPLSTKTKIMAVLLAALMAVTAAACSQGSQTEPEQPQPPSSQQPADQPSEELAEETVVATYQQLEEALKSDAPVIKLDSRFSTAGEETKKIVVERPVVLDGGGNKIDFGIEVLSGGVTVKNFAIYLSEFEKGVSASKGEGKPGDCIAIEIHNDAAGDPVVVTGVSIFLDVFQNHNSAIYMGDNSYVEISGNTIVVLNKENNSNERGGMFIGSGVTGKITGNTIYSDRTVFPMSPISLAANLDSLEEAVPVTQVEISGNRAMAQYFVKMYASGEFFGEDGKVLASDSDFGVRQEMSDFVAALAANNTFEAAAPYPAENEAAFVQCRLDKIMAGGSYFENNVFFQVEEGNLVKVPTPEE